MVSIYIGNLLFKASEQEVSSLFSTYGTVHSVKLISDRETGRSKGYGFVEMDEADAENAIKNLNGSSFGDRNIVVNIAKDAAKK